MSITEYKFKGKPAFKGVTKCPCCGLDFDLDTTDKEMFGRARCFRCFMEDRPLPKEPVGFVHFKDHK